MFFHLGLLPCKHYKRSLLIHLVNAAPACILALWRQTNPPSRDLWISKVEDLTSSLKGTGPNIVQTWVDRYEFREAEATQLLGNML